MLYGCLLQNPQAVWANRKYHAPNIAHLESWDLAVGMYVAVLAGF